MNRLTLKQTDQHLRRLIPLSCKDTCRLLWQPPKKKKDIVDVLILLCEYPDLSIPFYLTQGFQEALRASDSSEMLHLINNSGVTAHPRQARFVQRLKKTCWSCHYEENNEYVE